MDAKIADLQVIASTLRGATHAGCDDLSTCEGGPSCPTPFVTIGQAGSTEISLPVPPVTAVQAGYGNRYGAGVTVARSVLLVDPRRTS